MMRRPPYNLPDDPGNARSPRGYGGASKASIAGEVDSLKARVAELEQSLRIGSDSFSISPRSSKTTKTVAPSALPSTSASSSALTSAAVAAPAPKERVLSVFESLQRENAELRNSNKQLKVELEDVFALSQMLLENFNVELVDEDSPEAATAFNWHPTSTSVPTSQVVASSSSDPVDRGGSKHESVEPGALSQPDEALYSSRESSRLSSRNPCSSTEAYDNLGELPFPSPAQTCVPPSAITVSSEACVAQPTAATVSAATPEAPTGVSLTSLPRASLLGANVELLRAADKLVQKRASFAALIGRSPESLREQSNAPLLTKNMLA